MPLPQKVGNPGRATQMIGETPERVPFLAVDEVHPWGGFAVAMRQKVVLWFRHANDLKAVDSLHQTLYPQ